MGEKWEEWAEKPHSLVRFRSLVQQRRWLDFSFGRPSSYSSSSVRWVRPWVGLQLENMLKDLPSLNLGRPSRPAWILLSHLIAFIRKTDLGCSIEHTWVIRSWLSWKSIWTVHARESEHGLLDCPGTRITRIEPMLACPPHDVLWLAMLLTWLTYVTRISPFCNLTIVFKKIFKYTPFLFTLRPTF